MILSAISSTTSPSQGSASSLEDQKAKLETQIVECKACKTTPAKDKAAQLAQLEAQKGQVEVRLARVAEHAAEAAPAIREGSTIHVIA